MSRAEELSAAIRRALELTPEEEKVDREAAERYMRLLAEPPNTPLDEREITSVIPTFLIGAVYQKVGRSGS